MLAPQKTINQMHWFTFALLVLPRTTEDTTRPTSCVEASSPCSPLPYKRKLGDRERFIAAITDLFLAPVQRGITQNRMIYCRGKY